MCLLRKWIVKTEKHPGSQEPAVASLPGPAWALHSGETEVVCAQCFHLNFFYVSFFLSEPLCILCSWSICANRHVFQKASLPRRSQCFFRPMSPHMNWSEGAPRFYLQLGFFVTWACVCVREKQYFMGTLVLPARITVSLVLISDWLGGHLSWHIWELCLTLAKEDRMQEGARKTMSQSFFFFLVGILLTGSAVPQTGFPHTRLSLMDNFKDEKPVFRNPYEPQSETASGMGWWGLGGVFPSLQVSCHGSS